MITDHGGVNTAVAALVTKLGVTQEETSVSHQQTQAGERARAAMDGKTGADFDRTYIANEVIYHEVLLEVIEETLLPNTQDGELKALLEQTRSVVVDHLRSAQSIRASLGNSD